MLSEKNAQVSLFIIISILIAGLVIAFVLYNNQSVIKENINPEIQPIHNYVKSCIKNAGRESIYSLSLQGGYSFDISDIEYSDKSLFYYDQGKNNMITKEEFENEISKETNYKIFECVNFSLFPDFNVTENEISTKTEILEGKVVFNADYPLSIQKGDNVYEIERFEDIEVPVRLLTIYNVAEMLIQDHMENEGDICLSCISEWSIQYDLYFSMEDYEEDIVIFSITDKNSNINGEELEFKFANRY